MRVDYHNHCLPHMDDGARDSNISIRMVERLAGQGIEAIVATPHYYSHREGLERFLERRADCYARLMRENPPIPIYLGAEVRVEQGLSEKEGLKKACFQGTDVILLELPYAPYKSWMAEEIYNIAYQFSVIPLIAHLDRYISWYKKEELNEILQIPEAIIQINNEALNEHAATKFLLKLLEDGRRVVFGSDSHNMEDRQPDFDKADMVLRKKLKRDYEDVMERSRSWISLPEPSIL